MQVFVIQCFNTLSYCTSYEVGLNLEPSLTDKYNQISYKVCALVAPCTDVGGAAMLDFD